MRLEGKYFIKFSFTEEQISKNLKNAQRDLLIAKQDKILEVKFNYAYSALIKTGLALLSYNRIKVKSAPGHHVKIIEYLAGILKDDSISDIGNLMRAKRNLDLYAGGAEVTEKECREYISLVEKVLMETKAKIQ
jgi:hypothetical protein